MKQHVLFSLILAFFITAEQVSAQIVINEVQASNNETIEDVDGDSSDWVELLNTSATPFQIGGHGFSDDSTNLLKWIFPEHVMAPGERLLVWCSGKDLRFPSEEQVLRTNSTIQVRPTVLTLDQPWKYLTGAPESGRPPNFWNHSDFDDFTWPTGYPGFGFGDGDDRTELERGIGALFLRTTFDAPDIAAFENMVFQANYDDGFVLWLNGHRLLSVNFPEDVEPTFDSNSNRSREARRMQRWMTRDWVEHLQPQNNLLAVAVLNRTHSSNDMSFLPEIGTIDPSFHASFELDSDGEMVLLTSPAGEIIDGINLPEQSQDRTYGRVPDGTGEFGYLFYPTPGETNDTHVTENMISTDVEFTPPGGFQNGATNVSLSAEIPFDDFQIRYTTNGTAPTTSSTLYSGPISIARDTVIRAAGYLAGRLVLNPTSESYFITRRDFVLPVLSLSMNPNDYSNVHNNSGGRGRGSEVASFLEIFNANGEQDLKTGFGMRLHGGAGRGGGFDTKKAYKAYFRGQYGDTKLRYPIIPDTDVESFDKLILRSNFNDAFRTGGNAAYIRDQVIRDLHEDMGAIISHGSWYNMFVNMRFRGVYNVVERMDKDFFESYFPEDGENWDVVKTGDDALDGTTQEWSSMLSFFRSSNMTDPANYERAQQRIDLENYTSYMILNIWAQNHDWPHNNWYAARPRRADGKWIFLSWDAEFGMGKSPGGWSSDTFSHALNSGASISAPLISLMRSPVYANYFLNKFNEWIAGPLSSGNVLAEIARHRDRISGDMIEECQLSGQSINTWNNTIRGLEQFARNRPGAISNIINNSPRFPFPRITSVWPRTIELNGPDVEVRISGSNLTDDLTVLFNEIPSPQVRRTSSSRIYAIVPLDASLEGQPEISIVHPETGRYTLRNRLTITIPRPELRALQPDLGTAEGGDTILVMGNNFAQDVRIEFDGVPSPSVEYIGEDAITGEVLSVVTPPGNGFVKVRAFNPGAGDLGSEEELDFTYIPSPNAETFLRGDCDGDGSHSISDGVCILGYLFQSSEIGCLDSADADDSGLLGITDAVFLLSWMFRGGADPLAPFPGCGNDPTEDKLDCAGGNACN